MTHRHRILLAEDEEMHSFPMEVALKREGFEVDVVRNHDGVLEKGHDADALVIDARLPSEALEGLHVAAHLVREGLPESVPIIFISIYPEATRAVQNTIESLRELAGRYVWMEKWFEPNNLAKLVRRRIEQSKGSA